MAVRVGRMSLNVDTFLKATLSSKEVKNGLQERYFDKRVIKVQSGINDEFKALTNTIAEIASGAVTGAETTDKAVDRKKKGGSRFKAKGSVSGTITTSSGDSVGFKWERHGYTYSQFKKRKYPDSYGKFWFMSGMARRSFTTLAARPIIETNRFKSGLGVLVTVPKQGKIRFTTDLKLRKLPGIHAEYIGKMFLAGIQGVSFGAAGHGGIDGEGLSALEGRIYHTENSRPFIRKLSHQAGRGARSRLTRLLKKP
jgi:hypothetical protein